MIIEQTLHGYNKGHGLLASSFPVKPNDDSSLMSGKRPKTDLVI
ncbi:Uncharacterised protein [Segatella copri]|nr:Uncharacterised protein [Segatella copri]